MILIHAKSLYEALREINGHSLIGHSLIAYISIWSHLAFNE